MFVVFGLGNPGRKYRNTRHNLGYKVLDALAGEKGRRFDTRHPVYDVAELAIGGKEVWLVKPKTMMNRSGQAVQEIQKQHTLDAACMLVVCDDIGLPVGRVRIREKGSHGGHKGLASIIEAMSSERFPRLRLGIGAPRKKDAVHHVLSRFSWAEGRQVRCMIRRGADAVAASVERGIPWAMNEYNRSGEL